MSNNETADPENGFDIGKFLTFRSRISRGWYFLGLIGEIVFIFIALAAFAGLNNPTGGGSLELTVVFAIAALWVHVALVTGRVRDAGAAVILGIILGLAPFVWIALTAEYIETFGIVMLIVFLMLFLVPGLFKRPTNELPQA